MEPVLTTQLLRYEILKNEVREREVEIEALAKLIVPNLSPTTKIQAKQGAFTLGSRSKWKYTAGTERLAEQVKEQQKHEQQTGAAQEIKGDPYLIYKTNE
jgi:hypothetical protein